MASAYPILEHTGEYPIIGVNTFLRSKGSPTILPKKVIPAYAEAPAGRRATEEEKEAQSRTVENVQQAYAEEGKAALRKLQEAAIRNENMFEVLMEATKYCSLGQLTVAMFEVGAVHEEYVRMPRRLWSRCGRAPAASSFGSAALGSRW